MKIQFEKAWLVDGEKITEGWGFKPDTIKDGTLTRGRDILFTTNGKNFIERSWCYTILFDEAHAKMKADDNRKESVNNAKKQIEYYTKIANGQ